MILGRLCIFLFSLSLYLFFFFGEGGDGVSALAILELVLKIRLVLELQDTKISYLPSGEIKDVHPSRLYIYEYFASDSFSF